MLVSDHFSHILVGETQKTESNPLQWIAKFPETHSPKCKDKHVMLDQDSEPCENPLVHKLFKQCRDKVQPTGAGASSQNGTVKQNHRPTANHMSCLPDGANLETKFWSHAFHHMMPIQNGLVDCGQTKSPSEIVHKCKENLHNF